MWAELKIVGTLRKETMSTPSPVTEDKLTPMMAQWQSCKASAKEALLFFRMGDFYEAFYDDAIVIARELELTLTKRQGTPMCGVPWHAADGYIDRLVQKGHRVAIAEQTEDPKLTKKLVRREVVRIITPGTVVSSSLVPEKKNNFFAAIHQLGSGFGLAIMDVTTAEFRTTELQNETELLNELHRLCPSELLLSERLKKTQSPLLAELVQTLGLLLTQREEWHFDRKTAYDSLVGHFKLHSLDGLGLKGMDAAICAAGSLLGYLTGELCLKLDHVRQLLPYSTREFLTIDRMTERNLELTESLHGRGKSRTLLEVIDRTHTAMGGRLLRQWVKQPLLSIEKITARQDAIEALVKFDTGRHELTRCLSGIRDLERLSMRVCASLCNARDLVGLRISLEQLPQLKRAAAAVAPIQKLAAAIDEMGDVCRSIQEALVDEPPLRLGEGRTFREGFHPLLDELASLQRDSQGWLTAYQAQLREGAGIKTLKVGYNRVFGYYIEVSKGQTDRVPATFQRRQTLANCERYISPELKEYETKALNAEERMATLEAELFTQLRQQIAEAASRIVKTAQAIAYIDCLVALGELARERNYCRPTVDASDRLSIEEGRHPVIESPDIGERFIPNDTLLDRSAQQLIVLTGPNMAGKSTFIRQVALITLMSQMGSFVPAKSAHIGIVDRIFTRIGASDDLSRGQSTFMVEMAETANILNNATDRSLVILDEIGRGTSTYDGISIAWAVAEHLLTTPGKQARTLFATHYWELTELEKKLRGAVNFNVAVKETDGDVVFLHKIARGAADKSYGIHVARLAGLPAPVINRARELLNKLENSHEAAKTPRAMRQKLSEAQLTLF